MINGDAFRSLSTNVNYLYLRLMRCATFQSLCTFYVLHLYPYPYSPKLRQQNSAPESILNYNATDWVIVYINDALSTVVYLSLKMWEW
jgi:hypothetical protein